MVSNFKIQLRNNKEPAANPLLISDDFHSQFALDINQYRDNNNFVRHNKVETHDNRINFLDQGNEYTFIDFEKSIPWQSNSPLTNIANISYDGQPFKMEQYRQLWGAFFFYSTDKLEHSRDVMTWMGTFSELGGIYPFMFAIFGTIATFYN